MIDRSVEAPVAIKAICELPVDMIFLSISFLIAFIISNDENRNDGLLYWIVYLIISIGVVFVWRRSIKVYETGQNKSWLALIFVNLFITITCLIISINLLMKPEIPSKNENVEPNKTEINGNSN